MEDDRSLLIHQLEEFRRKVIEALADIRVDLMAYEKAFEEGRPVSSKRLRELKKEAQRAHEWWVDRYAERLPVLDGFGPR